ncbi:alanine racemase [Helcobacillus sp. ACRRO]|uniref:alanine racemase n=1 Tax=Helcobacillus sp. ACRRO TaxID=2918202 RepID=UPI001EF56FB1|nr:alanine racemase [Helcobacillus sp. ACRRO]MCG7426267.1 alanine racemase [Helcobacillus sp. ACRRO]
MTETAASPAPFAEEPGIAPPKARISKDAIRHNARQIRSALDEQTALMAVVKADGYSHGMMAAAEAAIAGGATWLGVAHPGSALGLARAGFDVPILTWLFDPTTALDVLPELISAGIDIGVGSYELLELVADAGRTADRRARVHLKIDTGMGRGGVLPEDLPKMTTMIRGSDYLHAIGAMSHFHSADVPGDPSIDEQMRVFTEACDALADEVGPIPLRHIANSAAALTRPDTHCDMARVGVALYGYPPVETDLDLRPAMTLTTRVAEIKTVQAGQTSGYGATYTCAESTDLGLLSIGYGDGLHRAASGRGWVAVRTDEGMKVVPQVGRISMDQMVVDLGPSSTAHAGDEAIIFGDPAANPDVPTAEDWARAAGTISYEVLTSINARVSRVVLDLTDEDEDTGAADDSSTAGDSDSGADPAATAGPDAEAGAEGGAAPTEPADPAPTAVGDAPAAGATAAPDAAPAPVMPGGASSDADYVQSPPTPVTGGTRVTVPSAASAERPVRTGQEPPTENLEPIADEAGPAPVHDDALPGALEPREQKTWTIVDQSTLTDPSAAPSAGTDASGAAGSPADDTAQIPITATSVQVDTSTAEETRRVAQILAEQAQAGDLIVLDGPLGAGKTTFTQGFGSQMNVRGTIASPTFVISRVHPPLGDGPSLVHVDAYRLDDDWDIEDLDLDSDLQDSVMLVEWGRDRVEHLTDSYRSVQLTRAEGADPAGDVDDPEEPRTIVITQTGPRYEDIDLAHLADRFRGAGLTVRDHHQETSA